MINRLWVNEGQLMPKLSRLLQPQGPAPWCAAFGNKGPREFRPSGAKFTFTRRQVCYNRGCNNRISPGDVVSIPRRGPGGSST